MAPESAGAGGGALGRRRLAGAPGAWHALVVPGTTPLDHAAARRLLGVADGAGVDEIRRAYRRLVRIHHPDVAGDRPDATARTAELAAAYAVLTGRRVAESAPTPERSTAPPRRPTPPPDPPPSAEARDGGLIAIGAPPGEAFLRLLDALESIGEVTYRDRANGDLHALLDLEGNRVELVVALEPRSVDTLAVVGVDAHDPGVDVDVDALLEAVAARVRAGWSS